MPRKKQELEESRLQLHHVIDEWLDMGMSVAIIARYPHGGYGHAYYGDRRGLYGTVCQIFKNGFNNEKRKRKKTNSLERTED